MNDPADLRSLGEFARAAAMLILCDALVRFVPFRAIARRVERGLPQATTGAAAELATRRVGWALGAVQRRLPWNVPCLATAIAANRLLARHGVPSELWLGVRTTSEATVDAHAWLVAEGRVVTGKRMHGEFTPLHALVTAVATAR